MAFFQKARHQRRTDVACCPRNQYFHEPIPWRVEAAMPRHIRNDRQTSQTLYSSLREKGGQDLDAWSLFGVLTGSSNGRLLTRLVWQIRLAY